MVGPFIKRAVKTVRALLHIISMPSIEASGVASLALVHMFACVLGFFFFLEELSDEYQTDYDEEAVESALSDYEAFNHGSEHTEGEETVDTVETVRHRCSISERGRAERRGDLCDLSSLSFPGRRRSHPSTTPTEKPPVRFCFRPANPFQRYTR